MFERERERERKREREREREVFAEGQQKVFSLAPLLNKLQFLVSL